MLLQQKLKNEEVALDLNNKWRIDRENLDRSEEMVGRNMNTKGASK